MVELARLLLLALINLKQLLLGQQNLQQTVDNFVREWTLGNLPGDLALMKEYLLDIRAATVSGRGANETIIDQIDALNDARTHTLQSVLDAIAALPAGSNIVIPPSATITSDVWAYKDPTWQQTAAVYQQAAGGLGVNLGASVGWRMGNSPQFILCGGWFDDSMPWRVDHYPLPDWTDIRATDTRLTWLQRTDVFNTWLDIDGNGEPFAWATVLGDLYPWFMRCAFTEADFQAFAARTRGQAAPIWPGIAAVTLGATVPCAESTVLELPMDGLLILITSYPPTRARWGAAPYYSVYHTGRLAFISDNGDVEEFQYMGWTSAVYTPRSMKRAGGVVIFLEPNVEAAATPWDVTS